MQVETDAAEATQSATVQESPNSARLVGCNSARWHKEVYNDARCRELSQ